VRTITVVLIILKIGLIMKEHAMLLAIPDKLEVLFSLDAYIRYSNATVAIILIVWTLFLGTFIEKFGPKSVIQYLLCIMAVTDVAATLICLLPLPRGLSFERGVWLELSVLASRVAKAALEVVCKVFLVGIVGPGERGTLLSLESFLDNVVLRISFPFRKTSGLLYALAGLPAVFALKSASGCALLLLFRRSALMSYRLKEM